MKSKTYPQVSEEPKSFHLQRGMKPAEGLLQSTVRRVHENSKQGSQSHTHMSKGDKCICVPVIVGVQVHQGTSCFYLFGICNLKQSVTLTAHLHCKQGKLRQVHGEMV